MAESISLKEAERKVFTTAFQDGLWDVLIGCFVLIFAITPFLSTKLGDFWSSAAFLPFWAAVYLAVRLIRRFVVTPRIGVVKLGQSRKLKLSRFVAVLAVVNGGGLLLGILAAQFSDKPGWMILTPFALLMLTIFSVAGYSLDFPRLYLYGVLVALSPLVGEWLYATMGASHHGFPITFGITAGLMIIVGLIKFVLLLRDHPKPVDEPSAVES
ncbi:MAG: hypothetical protein PVI07_08955 [Anaerolineae bacterium]|jgi:hypothetical protein